MVDGIKNKDQLLSLTLRQLRQEASKLSVPLYSRKTKSVLIDLIIKHQKKAVKKFDENLTKTSPAIDDKFYAEPAKDDVKTNIVFCTS